MCKYSVEELAKVVKGQLVHGNLKDEMIGVVTDSREATLKCGFFALKGQVSDGHLYIDQAVQKGARTLVVSDHTKVKKETFLNAQEDLNIIVVEDVLKALHDLAKDYLKKLHLKKIVAVTGSVGKTSTRDMIYYVSSMKYFTERNPKNYNNWVGLPLAILGFDRNCQVAVLEMGTSDKGQIATLVDIANPDIGVITNIGKSHIENFGSQEKIFEEKIQITKNFDETCTLIINGDGEILNRHNARGLFFLISVGEGRDNHMVISNVEDKGDLGISYNLRYSGKTYDVSLPVPGAHNSINSALAIAVGVELGISVEEAIWGLKNAKLTGSRLNIIEKNNIKIIDDCYNASLESMKSAISTLMATKPKAKGRRIAILGDIFELGNEAEAIHREIGKFLNGKEIDIVIAIGENSKFIVEENKSGILNENMFYYKDKNMAINNIKEIVKENDVVLIKASNGMGFSEISPILTR